MPDFLTEVHTLPNYRPFGQGRFDVTCRPVSRNFNVIVRVRYDFDWDSGRNWFAGALFWPTQRGRERFKQAYKKMIEEYWNGRCEITITGNHSNVQYVVQPNVTVVEDALNPHTVITPSAFPSGRHEVEYGHPHHWCHLYGSALNAVPTDWMTRLGFWMAFGSMGHDRAIFYDSVERLSAQVPRVHYRVATTQLVTPGRAKQAAQAIAKNAAVLATVPLILTGYRLSGEAVGLSLARANDLQTRLTNLNVPAGRLTVADGGLVPAPSHHPYVRITADRNALQNFLQQRVKFPMAAHEFGHMIGLPDEYEADTDPVAQQCITLANRLQVPVPPFSANTLSLMSMGYKVLPFHYLPFCAAIERMALNYRVANGFGAHDGTPVVRVRVVGKADPEERVVHEEYVHDFGQMVGW